MEEQDKALVRAYAKHNMNLAQTSKEVYMHYNSIRYRFQKIREETGLNPQDFHDLEKLLNMEALYGNRPDRESTV